MTFPQVSASALLTLILAGCIGPFKKDDIHPDPPEMKLAPSPPVPVSAVNIPITVDLEPFLAKLEKTLPDSLGRPAFEETFGGKGLDHPDCGVECGFILRRGPLSYKAHDDTLELAADLGYGFKCRKRFPCRGPVFTGGCGFEDEEPRKARLHFSGTLGLRSDWSTPVRTRLDSMTAVSKCEVTRLKVDVTDLLLKKSEETYGKHSHAIDSLLESHLSLRKRAGRIWKQLNDPIRLTENLFLDLNPGSVALSQPSFSGSEMNVSFGLIASPEIRTDREPDSAAPPLPDIKPHDSDAERFTVFMPVHLEFEKVNRRLREVFRLDSGGLRFPDDGLLKVTVDKASLTGYGDRLLLKLHIRGAVGGTVYLTGIPVYDTTTKVLSAKDVKYSLESMRVLENTMDWLAHGSFTDIIRSRLTFNVGKDVDSLRAKIDKALNKKHKKLQLSGGLDHLALSTVRSDAMDSGLVVRFEATGRLKVRVE